MYVALKDRNKQIKFKRAINKGDHIFFKEKTVKKIKIEKINSYLVSVGKKKRCNLMLGI